MKTELATKIASAIEEVNAAEKDLDALLGQIQIAPRAEKTAVSNAVREALARLRQGRAVLLELQDLVLKQSGEVD